MPVKETEIVRTRELFFSMYFTRITIFADVIERYVEIDLQKKFNWLKLACLYLMVRRNGVITPGELARIMLRPKHSITSIISGLVQEKLVTRHRGKDRRTLKLQITQKGITYMREASASIAKVEEAINRCLTKSELHLMVNQMGKIRQELIELINDKKE